MDRTERLSSRGNFRRASPEAVEVAVGCGVERAGGGEAHAEAGGGGGGGRAGSVGEGRGVRGKIGAAELDRGRGAGGHEVQGDPADVVLRGVGVRDFAPDVDLDVERDSGRRGCGRGNGRNVLFRFPVGGLDGGRERLLHWRCRCVKSRARPLDMAPERRHVRGAVSGNQSTGES